MHAKEIDEIKTDNKQLKEDNEKLLEENEKLKKDLTDNTNRKK
jgi:regulator of replication initiation timing